MDYLTLVRESCQDTRMLVSICISNMIHVISNDYKVIQKREKEKAMLVSVDRELCNAIFVAGIMDIGLSEEKVLLSFSLGV